MTTTKQDNGRYWTRFRVDGVPYAKRFDRKQDGIDWENTTKSDLVRGTYINPKAGQKLFGVFAKEWAASLVHQRSGSRKAVESILKNHILPEFENKPLAVIKRQQVQTWVNKLISEGLAPSTIAIGPYGKLQSIFRAAVEEELIRNSPCRKINLPEDLGHSVLIPTVEQVDVLDEAMNPRWKTAVWVGAGVGARIGECMGLTEDHIDFDNALMTIDRQMQTDENGQLVIVPVKTKAGVRTVPVGERTLTALRTHLDTWPRGECVDVDGKIVRGLVFTNRDGGPVRHQSWNRQWHNALKNGKGLLPEDLRFHDLRHFFASMLLRAGISDIVVAKRMGHASTDELKIYGHEWHDDVERTRDAINSILATRLRLVS